MKIMKKLSAIVISIVVCGVFAVPTFAWGPERPTYTNEKPAEKATFNSITDNAAILDERNFVRVVRVGSNEEYANSVVVRGGEQYRVMIFYHNDASATYNKKEYNYQGVARNVRVATQFPTSIKKGEIAEVVGVITSTNAEPGKIWDEAKLVAGEDVELSYVVGSAKIYNKWEANESVLSENLFSEKGTFIGMNELNGIILGCTEYSGQVVYTLEAKATNPTPVEPEPEPEPTPEPEPEPTPDPNPEVQPDPEPEPISPKELPDTGPAEIILFVVIAVALIGGVSYYVYSHIMLKKVKESVLGVNEENEENEENNDNNDTNAQKSF